MAFPVLISMRAICEPASDAYHTLPSGAVQMPYGPRPSGASNGTVFASIFTFLLAASYLLSVVFPALERHMANVFFGDLATLTEFDSKVTLILGGGCLAGLVWFWKPVSNQSFEMATYGEGAVSGHHVQRDRLFLAITLVVLCYAVQFIGFSFTMTMLFLPTTILAGMVQQGLRLHLLLSGAVAFFSVIAGFLLSLSFIALPTVPMITLVAALSALTVVVVSRLGGARGS